MSDKEQREAYIRASDRRVALWPKARREAFYRAVDRMNSQKPLNLPRRR